jgi:hypothetical protein
MSSVRLPGLLLSTEALLGVTRHPRERTLEVRRRCQEPGALARIFAGALEAGADGVLLAPTAESRAAAAAMGGALPVYAHVPNVPEFVRDSTELGLPGTALKRLRGAPPATFLRLGLTGMSHATGVLKGDFLGMVPIMLELEVASLGARNLRGVVLSATLTDMVLAGGHRALFAHLVPFIRARFGALAGFETHNLGHLLRRLREWGVQPDLVVGPLNPLGFMMKPAPGQVLAEMRATGVPVLAKEIAAGGVVGLVEGASFARSHGARGVVVDLVDVGDESAARGSLAAVAGAGAGDAVVVAGGR